MSRPNTAGTQVDEKVEPSGSSTASRGDEERKADKKGKSEAASPSAKPEAAAAPAGTKKSILDRLPPWISTNLRSPNSWKVFLRCWLASWIAFLLLLPNASLQVLGNTYVNLR